MNVLNLFREPLYLRQCQFCFEPVDKVEVLIVSHEGKTSICNHCAQISVDQVSEQRRQNKGQES